MKTNGNDPSMPNIPEIQEYENLSKQLGCDNIDNNRGLTKREHFAAMAMQGLCVGKISKDIMGGQCVDIAQEAVEIADALIKALNERP